MELNRFTVILSWYVILVFVLVYEVVFRLRRQWRNRRDTLLALDRLLGTVEDDVPYYDDDGASSSSSSCVICLSEYGQGEGRFVLPRCAHAFHRSCIVPWLRRGRNSCPICRGTVVVAAASSSSSSSPPVYHQPVVNTAPENMV